VQVTIVFFFITLAGMLALIVAGTSPATYSSGVGVTVKLSDVNFIFEHELNITAMPTSARAPNAIFFIFLLLL
jgi:hypothetical protein